LTLTLKICILQGNGFKELTFLVRKPVLRATRSVLQHFWLEHLLEHSKAMNEPQKCSNDLERSKFRQQVQSFVWVQP
jgi:hypothetical protein